MAKQGRRLTRVEKSNLIAQGMNPKEWEYAYNINDSYYKIRNKKTGVEKTVDKYRKARNRYDY